jgi:hypothetical protein
MFIGVFIVAIAVGGAAPWRSLSPCLLGKWTGITVTNANGDVVGPEDPSDWGCVGGGSSGRPGTPEDVVPVPAPPPTSLCLLPAYPNPTSTAATLMFSLPTTSQVSLVVYAKKGNGPHGAFPVRALVAREMAAGFYTVVWDGNDDRGMRVAPDIYRVALVVDDQGVCGDVEIR